jgi:predicted PurR-regulated permease PerM
VLALVLCFLIARPFVSSLAWATALAVVAWPLHRRLAQRIRWPTAAAALSVVRSLCCWSCRPGCSSLVSSTRR